MAMDRLLMLRLLVSIALVWWLTRLNVDSETRYASNVLGVSPYATEAEIRQQFRQLSIRRHPDKVRDMNPEIAHEQFLKLASAYTFLSKNKRRPTDSLEQAHGVWRNVKEKSYVLIPILILLATLYDLLRRMKPEKPLIVSLKDKDMTCFELLEDMDDVSCFDVFLALSTSSAFANVQVGDDFIALMLVQKALSTSIYAHDYLGLMSEISTMTQKKVLLLLYAHLERIELGDDKLIKDQQCIVLTASKLVHAWIDQQVDLTWTSPSIHPVLVCSQCIRQAVHPRNKTQQESATLSLNVKQLLFRRRNDQGRTVHDIKMVSTVSDRKSPLVPADAPGHHGIDSGTGGQWYLMVQAYTPHTTKIFLLTREDTLQFTLKDYSYFTLWLRCDTNLGLDLSFDLAIESSPVPIVSTRAPWNGVRVA